ncbi:hypothetical protein Btru_048740 [Bulinus truncatus]|nr:hypothetical protein Btru_048740 [Bulinus truncatus]
MTALSTHSSFSFSRVVDAPQHGETCGNVSLFLTDLQLRLKRDMQQLILAGLLTLACCTEMVRGFIDPLIFNSNICAPPPPCGDLPPGCHYMPDTSGCPSCNLACPGEMDCVLQKCALFCQYGNVVNEHGCQICRCNPPPSAGMQNPEFPPFLH